jgi:hypothetical protein
MRLLRLPVFALLLSMPLALAAQAAPPADDAGAKNARQARAVLDAMVQALGGEAWLEMKNQTREGHVASFFQGKPSPGTTLFFEFHAWPDHDRVEYTKHRDVVQIYSGHTAWEVTYRGKKPLPEEQTEDFLRRRSHSIETAVRLWLQDPRTILVYEGQHLAARHLADQVTLISAQNEAVTILTDVQTHLPLRRTFQWRDPVYKDKNLDAEEYDDYHLVDGFPSAFTITRFKNDDMVSQRFIDHIHYNQPLDADFWNADAVELRIKK